MAEQPKISDAATASVMLGVDTGGTFTDFVALDAAGMLRIHKVLSTPAAPEQAILAGIGELGLMTKALNGQLLIVHGSTVATNAALENKGVRTVFITNRGFKDMLTLARQTRAALYNLQPAPVNPPVAESLCLETGGRLSANAEVIEDLTDKDIQQLVEQVNRLKPEAVAINLLFSFLDDRFEKAIEQALPTELFISRSSYVLPEYKEYERGMTTWLNAWLGPLVKHYLAGLSKHVAPSPVAVMQSSGGTIDANQAANRAVNMLLSGPAGGLAAARYISDLIESKRLLTFDMGGTSTDVALVDGDIQLTNEGRIGNYPVAVPMVDMHTIGAGGGSIARVDAGGLLHVGPESAGANPGPACYGSGAIEATVTDANAVLGRLPADQFLGGTMTLNLQAARKAIANVADRLGMTVEQAAQGVIELANDHMVRALRVISVQRGYDPSQFSLCSFGGAGGLHVCALAEQLNMPRAVVPVNGGVLSALGMLVAPHERQLSRTCPGLLDQQSDQHVTDVIAELDREGRRQLHQEGISDAAIVAMPSLDLRYRGQSYTLTIDWKTNDQAIGDFHQYHRQRYGHDLQIPVELVNVRLALRAQTQNIELPRLNCTTAATPFAFNQLYGIDESVALYHRGQLAPGQVITGPALIVEQVSTTLITCGWKATVDDWGNLLLSHLIN